MNLYILITEFPNKPNTSHQAHVQGNPYCFNILPCTPEIVHTRFEDVRTLLYVFKRVAECFRTLRTMGKCTSRHAFSYTSRFTDTVQLFYSSLQAVYTMMQNFVIISTAVLFRIILRSDNHVVGLKIGYNPGACRPPLQNFHKSCFINWPLEITESEFEVQTLIIVLCSWTRRFTLYPSCINESNR